MPKVRKVKGVLITKSDIVLTMSKIEFNDTLDELHELVNCELVEMPIRYINGVPYTFIIDEEGKLKDEQVITAISKDLKTEYIEGNILIVSGYTNDNGDILSLDDKDFKNIASAIHPSHEFITFDYK